MPHFSVDESNHLPEARGFVNSSFVQGLNAQEYFAAAQGGREGMTDTSIKSVTHDTLVLLRKQGDGDMWVSRIGDYIDEYFELAYRLYPDAIKSYPSELNTEIFSIPEELGTFEMPTVDENGSVFWGALTTLTRHDADTVLYKVYVQSFNGRVITVTVPGSKSLLIYTPQTDQLTPMKTTQVKIGDLVPVVHPLTLYDNVCGETLVCDGYLQEDNRCRDVALQPILQIEKIVLSDPSKVKLYDVTLPATYNFVLANGLGVRDTRDSGYFTRKIVKFFENVTVAYDGTVRIQGPKLRDAEGTSIVQFEYGDDGIDPMYLELQVVSLYNADDVEIDRLALQNTRWYKTLTSMNAKLHAAFDSNGTNKFYVPVNVKQLIAYALNSGSSHKVIDMFSLREDQSVQPIDDKSDSWYERVLQVVDTLNSTSILIKAHLIGELAPFYVQGLNMSKREWLLAKVIQHFETARVSPGEKIGIIAAQSFGQLAVQATLNT